MTYTDTVYNFLKKLAHMLASIIKIILLSKPLSADKTKFRYKNCLILGNGPSLTESLKNQDLIQNKTIFCVNYFPTTHFFEKLQPEVLMLQAPEFWLDDVIAIYKVSRNKLFDAIVQKTCWRLIIYVPVGMKKNKYFLKLIDSNKYIKMNYYNTTPVEGFRWFEHFCFRKKIGLPRPHNIVIPSLVIAINKSFEKIYLSGVDHSWLKEIIVNDKNESLVGFQHFYENKGPQINYRLGKRPRKLYEILEKLMFTFRSYLIIQEYAKSRKVSIYNTTKDSYIDAFDKL